MSVPATFSSDRPLAVEYPPIRLMGAPSIGGDYSAISKKHFALLTYLAAAEGKSIGRAHLAKLFWPMSNEASGRHSLSQGLYAIRSAVRRSSVIKGDGNQLFLAVGSSDLGMLTRAYGDGRWVQFARLYKGELLDGVELSGLRDFDDWLDAKRVELSDCALRALEALRLDGNREVARPLAVMLEKSEATAHDSVIEQVAHPHSIRTNSACPLPFVGRQAELEELEKVFEMVDQNGPTLVVLEGEAGVGKTTLLNRFVRRRVLRGSMAVLGAAYPPEKNVAFGVVRQWLGQISEKKHLRVPTTPWVSIVKEAFPFVDFADLRASHIGKDVARPTGQQQLYEALRRLFEYLGKDTTIVVALDDINNADAASLGFVHYFLRNSNAPIIFAATARSDARRSEAEPRTWRNAARIHIPPLAEPDIAHLLQELPFQGGAPQSARFWMELTGGNPLLLSAVLDSGTSDGFETIPHSVFDFLQPQLSSLSTDCGRLLGALAVLGEPAEPDLIAAVAGLSPESAPFDELLDSNFAVEIAAKIVPRHGLVVEVMLSELHPAERRRLHGRAARELAATGTSPPALLAVQHDIAGNSGEAFEAALQAAAASEILCAYREREFFLKLALSHSPDEEHAGRTRIALAALLTEQGRNVEASELLHERWFDNVGAGTENAAAVYRCIAGLSMVRNVREVLMAISFADHIRESIQPELVIELYGNIAASAHAFGLAEQTTYAASTALSTFKELGEGGDTRWPYKAITLLGFYNGYDHALNEIDQLFPPQGLSARPEMAARRLAKASLLVTAGELFQAEQLFLEAVELTERFGLYDQMFALRNNFGVCLMEQGRYAEAEKQFDDAEKCICAPEVGAIVLDNRSILEFERGDYNSCIDRSRHALESGNVCSVRGIVANLSLLGLASLEAGQLAAAYHHRRDLVLKMQQYEYWSVDMSYVQIFLARMESLGGDLDAARDRLSYAISVYRCRDLLVRARLELELLRLDVKSSPRAVERAAAALLDQMRGKGAQPLFERLESVHSRAVVASTG